MEDCYPLNNLGRQIKAHWRKYRPKMYRALEQSGKLDESIYAAQQLTSDALNDLVERGMDWNQAWELIREEWAFLPAEEDEEEQPPDPLTLIERYEQRRRQAGEPTPPDPGPFTSP